MNRFSTHPDNKISSKPSVSLYNPTLPKYVFWQDEFMHSDDHESSPGYQIVLATVRQNVIFQRCLQSLREGDFVR